MSAGSLNRRITLQRRAVGQDATGQPIETWQDVATVWASIRHLSGVDSIKADRDVSVARASIRLRYRLDIDAGMRVKHGGVIYGIKAVLPDEVKREYVDLACEVVS